MKYVLTWGTRDGKPHRKVFATYQDRYLFARKLLTNPKYVTMSMAMFLADSEELVS